MGVCVRRPGVVGLLAEFPQAVSHPSEVPCAPLRSSNHIGTGEEGGLSQLDEWICGIPGTE